MAHGAHCVAKTAISIYHDRLAPSDNCQPTRLEDVCEGTPVALGRSHASWFLVYARPAGMVMKRLHMCLNFVVPGDASTVSAVSPDSGQPCFTVGGSRGEEVMDALLALRDENGRAPVKVVKEYPADDPYQLRAVVQVEVSEKELIHACARCGRWEAIFGARFLRCGMCRSRSYCSKQCQKQDWKPAYHKGECALIKEGKAFEVEERRKLHNNGWWFDYSDIGTTSLLIGSGEDDYERAMDQCDNGYLAYGRRFVPRDVPPDTRPPDTGFIPTGDGAIDGYLLEVSNLKASGAPDFLLDAANACSGQFSSSGLAESDIPEIPPLPASAGFVLTGDPTLDELRLFHHLSNHESEEDMQELQKVLDERAKATEMRSRLRDENVARALRNREAATARFNSM